jgi:hypothetical protein
MVAGLGSALDRMNLHHGLWIVCSPYLVLLSNQCLCAAGISVAHPTFLTKEEIAAIGVPVQIVAPEHGNKHSLSPLLLDFTGTPPDLAYLLDFSLDQPFTPELKTYARETIPIKNVPFDYQHFPRVQHGFATRGKLEEVGERTSMLRAKRTQVAWMKEWLHGEE